MTREKNAFELFCLTGDIHYYLIYKEFASLQTNERK